MLTVTAPIKLNTEKTIIGVGEGFCQRMTSNYDMMSLDVTPESLLHVTTETPEYYFAQDGQTDINNTTNININEQNKMSIVNNLVNRIMVEPSFGLMYQDRVYISNALKKLGIRDEKNFMKQVYSMREEMTQTNRLIDMYFAYGDNIKNLVEEYTDVDASTKKETTEQNEYALHLHEDIFSRLKTALIYSIVENFHENVYGDNYISTNEMMIAEQKRVFENILLKELQSDVRGENVPLIYKAQNLYEEYDFDEENITDEKITEVINAATLLNYINNALETRITNKKENINNWIHMQPALSISTQNALQRLESHVKNEVTSNIFNITNQEINNRIMRNEIDLLSQITNDNRLIENYEDIDLTYKTEVQETILEEDVKRIEQEFSVKNRQNIENRNILNQVIREERESVQRKLSDSERKQRQRQHSLEALNNPGELIMTLRKEQAIADENEALIAKAAAQRTLPEQEQIFNLINQYMENPSIPLNGITVTSNDIGTLARDIERVEMVNRENTREISENTETVERISKEVSRELTEETITPGVTRRVRERLENLDLTHRTVETQNIEEVAEQIFEQNRIQREKTNQTEEFVTHHTVENTNVVNENLVNMEEINRNITETVNNTVNQSLNTFSDQVYRRIESKLELEKRRRGL